MRIKVGAKYKVPYKTESGLRTKTQIYPDGKVVVRSHLVDLVTNICKRKQATSSYTGYDCKIRGCGWHSRYMDA